MFDRFSARVDAIERRINDALPAPLKVGALVLYLHSTRHSDRLDAVADRPLWDRWGDAAVVVLLALQATGLVVVGAGAWLALGQERATALNDPVNTVAVPGVNAFMPPASAPYVVAALIVATLVHEGGHAVACRRAGIPIEEYGVALVGGVVPLAAYVLPGDELDDAAPRIRMRVYAAGVANNLVLAAAAWAVLTSPLTASPLAAYLTYFGWALTGGLPPDAAAVAALGPLTNLAFWTALLSGNLALLNALPVAALDGGRVLALAMAAGAARLGHPLSPRGRRLAVHAVGTVTVVGVLVAVVGPLF